MAEWLRHSLAEWKVPGSNLTLGKVSGKVSEKVLVKKKKKKKKRPAILCLHDGSPDDGSCSPTHKKAGVCASMSI